jgi:serine/threonine protein kinase
MQQVCLQCERTSPDANLYCQETYCPAEMSPIILGYGEWLGDIEIVKPVMVLRSAVLYEATHHKNRVFLKVAHPGRENAERLKREADFLKKIQFSRQRSPYLPILRPPYVTTTLDIDTVGKTMLGDHLLYYYMFEHIDAEPLRDVLTKNPQLWLNHVGWVVISLSYGVAVMHHQGLLHCALSPDSVLIRFDEKMNVPRVLLFDLGVVSDNKNFAANWSPDFIMPAYTAPEMTNSTMLQPNYATDVYGLGLILYEMLIGKPPIAYRLRSDPEIIDAIRRNQRVKMSREDAQAVAQLTLNAVHPQIAQRPADAAAFAQTLMKDQLFGKVPPEPKSRRPKLNNILVVIAALLTSAFFLTLLIVLIGGFFG